MATHGSEPRQARPDLRVSVVRQRRAETQVPALALQGGWTVQQCLWIRGRRFGRIHVVKQVWTDDMRDWPERVDLTAKLLRERTGECSSSLPDDRQITVIRVPTCKPMKE